MLDKATTMPTTNGLEDLLVEKLGPDDVEFAYDLYCRNNAFIDPDIYEKPILDANRHLCSQDFLDILSDDNTFSLLCIRKRLIKSKMGSHYLNDKVGFLCFEKNIPDKYVRIVFIEAKDKNKEVYDIMINNLIESIGSNKYKKILIDVEDGRYDVIEGVSKNKFVEYKMFTPPNGPDIFAFEKTL